MIILIKICMMICIYKITNPKGKVYIGQTINFHVRKLRYLRSNCKNQSKLYNSIIKYGIDNHTIEIILECEEEVLNKMERYYQELYDSVNSGLNIRLTKSSDRSGAFSEEAKQKMSIAKIGKKRSIEVCKSISERMKELASKREPEYYKNFKPLTVHTIEHRSKNSLAKRGNTFRKGKTHTNESKKKMSESKKGSKATEETKNKMRISQIKAWEKRRCL